jgi:hypothetical protein
MPQHLYKQPPKERASVSLRKLVQLSPAITLSTDVYVSRYAQNKPHHGNNDVSHTGLQKEYSTRILLSIMFTALK